MMARHGTVASTLEGREHFIRRHLLMFEQESGESLERVLVLACAG
jgi:hypothetical protein